MFKDINELKEFLIWCRSQKVKKVMLETGTSVEFSDLAFVEDLQTDSKEMFLGSKSTLMDTLKPNQKEDDEDLFWSVGR